MLLNRKEPGYPEGFEGLLPLELQAERLKAVCARLGMEIDISSVPEFAKKIADIPLSEGAEGWAVVLRRNLIDSRPDALTARELLAEGVSREMDNRILEIDEHADRFRVSERTQEMFNHLCATQPESDICVMQVQLGLRNAKTSDADALQNLAKNEFGLSFLSGASILATHPERLGKYFDLGISFPGEEYDYDGDKAYSRTVLGKTNQGRLMLMHFPPRIPWMNDHGAATGFVWE